jgi:hypothetical protein
VASWSLEYLQNRHEHKHDRRRDIRLQKDRRAEGCSLLEKLSSLVFLFALYEIEIAVDKSWKKDGEKLGSEDVEGAQNKAAQAAIALAECFCALDSAGSLVARKLAESDDIRRRGRRTRDFLPECYLCLAETALPEIGQNLLLRRGRRHPLLMPGGRVEQGITGMRVAADSIVSG